ncbi:acyltransferase [Sphingomonas sp. ASV193]|uniref:acyltransferase family protein n=1 Tax=Sphingomonas sp. ASV193 TaxID=3144405 RepID=UPI0032E90C14
MTKWKSLPSKRAFAAFDGMRGVAAIAVVFFHIGATIGIAQLAPFGYLAVDLFFMLSGFVVGNAYECKILSGELTWRRFMLIRIARLFPGLFLGCLIAWVINPMANIGDALRAFALIPQFGTNVLFPINPVLWSLFFELLINAIHGAVAKRLSTRILLIFLAVAGVAYIAAALYYRGPGLGWGRSTFLAGFARICWGYGVGLAVFRFRAFLPDFHSKPAVCVTAVALVLFSPNLGLTAPQVAATLFVVFPACLVVGCLSNAEKNYLFALLGAASYPLYAVHYPLIVLIERLGLIKQLLPWLLAGLGIIAFAVALERFVERPMRNKMRILMAPARVP